MVDLERPPASNNQLVHKDKGNDLVFVVQASPYGHQSDQTLVAFSVHCLPGQLVVRQQMLRGIRQRVLAAEEVVLELSAFLCITLPR